MKLRIILGENDSQRLIIPDGIPESVNELAQQIKRHGGVEGDFRLQFMDAEFGNEFTNWMSISDVQDKGTITVIFISAAQPGGSTPHPSAPPTTLASASSCSSDDSSSLSSGCPFDTDILSSPESTPSRSSAWPVVFQIPRFSYDTELQLDRANAAFKTNRTLLNS